MRPHQHTKLQTATITIVTTINRTKVRCSFSLPGWSPKLVVPLCGSSDRYVHSHHHPHTPRSDSRRRGYRDPAGASLRRQKVNSGLLGLRHSSSAGTHHSVSCLVLYKQRNSVPNTRTPSMSTTNTFELGDELGWLGMAVQRDQLRSRESGQLGRHRKRGHRAQRHVVDRIHAVEGM